MVSVLPATATVTGDAVLTQIFTALRVSASRS
jgi:hypothetical protein